MLRGRAPFATPLLALSLLAVSLVAPSADAQSLRGSRASVDRAYRFAMRGRLPFHRSMTTVRRSATRGRLVRVASTGSYRLRGVGIPFMLPATRSVLASLAARYRRQCGERLIVTSGMRLTAHPLVNSTPRSVHPAGMAFDLRAPHGRCRTWIRTELLSLERRGLIDATEERSPAHLHVVVFRAR